MQEATPLKRKLDEFGTFLAKVKKTTVFALFTLFYSFLPTPVHPCRGGKIGRSCRFCIASKLVRVQTGSFCNWPNWLGQVVTSFYNIIAFQMSLQKAYYFIYNLICLIK